MSPHRIRVFVSSKLQELADERRAVKSVLEEMFADTYLFEMDAGARPQTISQTVRPELDAADLYIGIFWKSYGTYIAEEYEYARKLGKDCLIYEKRSDIEG